MIGGEGCAKALGKSGKIRGLKAVLRSLKEVIDGSAAALDLLCKLSSRLATKHSFHHDALPLGQLRNRDQQAMVSLRVLEVLVRVAGDFRRTLGTIVPGLAPATVALIRSLSAMCADGSGLDKAIEQAEERSVVRSAYARNHPRQRVGDLLRQR